MCSSFLPAQQASWTLPSELARAVKDGIAQGQRKAHRRRVAAKMVTLHDGIIPDVTYVYGPPTGRLSKTPPRCAGLVPGFALVTPSPCPAVAVPRCPHLTVERHLVSDYNETKRTAGYQRRPHRVPDRNRRFYTEHAVAQYNRAFRRSQQPMVHHRPEARFFAMANLAIIDSQIACWTQVHYSFWRPSTAIRAGGGNASLVADPTWLPLATTRRTPSTGATAADEPPPLRCSKPGSGRRGELLAQQHHHQHDAQLHQHRRLQAEIIGARIYGA